MKYFYREHTGRTGGARCDNVIAGHEPSGQVVDVGKGAMDFYADGRMPDYHGTIMPQTENTRESSVII